MYVTDPNQLVKMLAMRYIREVIYYLEELYVVYVHVTDKMAALFETL